MAKTAWLDRMIRRVRAADSDDAALAITKDYIDPMTGDAVGGGPGGENDTHIHLHMNGHGEPEMGGGMDQAPPVAAGGGGDPQNSGGNDIAQLAARVAALEEIVQQLQGDDGGGEEEVELTDPDTQDARRFTMRRGRSIASRDEAEIPVPERLGEDMVGETDLPGLEDLQQGSDGNTTDSRRRRRRVARTRDSMDQEDLWSDLVANAEIIAPGTRIPTFDARLPMASTAERLCKYRRLVMEKAFKDADTAAVIKDTVGIATFDGIKPLGCDSVKMAFNAVASAMAQQNNGRTVRSSAAQPTRDGMRSAGGPPSIAQMNKDAKDFWNNQRTNGATRH